MIGHWLLLYKTHSGVHPCTGIRPRGVTGDGEPPLEMDMSKSGRVPANPAAPLTDSVLGNPVVAIGWRAVIWRADPRSEPTAGCFVTPTVN